MRAVQILRRLIGDRRGTSAVEFALIAPLMLFMYAGVTELTQAHMAQKRVSHVASVIADLAAQEAALTQAMVDDIFAAGEHILLPFEREPLTQRLTSIERRANGTTVVLWSRSSGAGALRSTADIPLPRDVLGNGETIIVAEASYAFTSPLGAVLPNGLTLNAIYYLRPRQTVAVTCC